ncbi:site-specific recombinase XerD [Rhizobium sp. BK049]|uniref:tyrosine-type recombinase/integrase n=1 Tax=Rhizobium sp. BK049 TaxID=2587095 RepID=UPI001609669B|nr:site-specific integrase [Rhizobium sp. BK049]MBB3352679.1 site-specific recombinase XerD [Rhizobium sp. BK049]
MSEEQADTKRTSAKVLEERLRRLFDADFHGEEPFWTRKGLSRPWLARLIGCKAATLSSSPRLKRLIGGWEGPRIESRRQSAWQSSPEEADNVVLLRLPRHDGRIISSTVKLHKHIWEVPTLVWPSGLDEEVNDWFRYLIVKLKRAWSTVEETAKHMRQFIKYRRKRRVPLRAVDDDFLLNWQGDLREGDTKKPRRNALLRTVHSFFKWAEEHGIVRHMVQIGRPSAYAESMLAYEFPISSHEVTVLTSKGRTRVYWVWPFLEKGDGTKYGRRYTPTFKEIDRIYAFTDVQRHGVRNVLIMNWALRTGARVSEILSIRLQDLPATEEEIAELIEKDQWIIKLKKRKRRSYGGVLYAPADLIWDTLNYVRSERHEIASAKGGKGVHAVFLSQRGSPLVTDSVSRICAELFRAALVYNANIHRLRARFAHNAVELTLRHLEEVGVSLDPSSGWHETALIITAQVMGHSSPRSLEPYLHDIMFRRAEEARLKSQGAAPSFDAASPARRQDMLDTVESARKFLEGGEDDKAWRLLRRVTNEIDRARLFEDAWANAA